MVSTYDYSLAIVIRFNQILVTPPRTVKNTVIRSKPPILYYSTVVSYFKEFAKKGICNEVADSTLATDLSLLETKKSLTAGEPDGIFMLRGLHDVTVGRNEDPRPGFCTFHC